MKKTVFLLAFILPVCALFAQLPAPVIPLDGNISTVEQIGDDNEYNLTQDGTRNFAEVYTVGEGNAVSFVDQDGTWNTNTVTQMGDGNSVDVTQKNEYDPNPWNLNFSWIEQTGNDNTAEVYQSHQPLGATDHLGPLVSYTHQSGDRNASVQKQKGLINLAIVAQAGNDGSASQFQGTSEHVPDEYSYGAVAAIVQLPGADFAVAEQHQVGAFNAAGIIQNSDESFAGQLQISDQDEHISNLLETPNVAGIIQDGSTSSGNEAYQVQYYDNVTDFGNWAGAYQNGGDNYSMQVQAGGQNASGVIQVGDGNVSNVTQSHHGASVPVNPWTP